MRAKPIDRFFITSERFQNRAHGRNFAGIVAAVDCRMLALASAYFRKEGCTSPCRDRLVQKPTWTIVPILCLAAYPALAEVTRRDAIEAQTVSALASAD